MTVLIQPPGGGTSAPAAFTVTAPAAQLGVTPSTNVPAVAPVDASEPDGAGQPSREGSSPEYRVEASEQDDDLLRDYLPSERPARFDSLPLAEQAWRGRLFLMTWAFTGSAAYAWAASGVTDPTECHEEGPPW
jgi:hypothetical protein